MAPRWRQRHLKVAPRAPNGGAKGAKRWCQRRPKVPKSAQRCQKVPKGAKRCPKVVPKAPKGSRSAQIWRQSHPKVAPNSPKGGADGAAPPDDEGNPAEGGCFASVNIT